MLKRYLSHFKNYPFFKKKKFKKRMKEIYSS